jgi:hypothetical protein
VNEIEEELQREDDLLDEISKEDDYDSYLSAVPVNGNEAEGGFFQGSIDAEDLATGFNLTIPTKETDVDEDTQGDEPSGVGDEPFMTELEVSESAANAVHGDEIELDLENVLTTGRTVAKPPSSN